MFFKSAENRKNTTNEISGEIVIYNMLGQPEWRESLNDDDRSSFRVNLPTGYYVVSIITGQHVSNSKVLIR